MDRPTLLFLGRITPKKGLSELIAAFARAAPRLPGWRLVIAGWNDNAGDVRAEAVATGADIVFPGPLFGEAKAAAYAGAAAFVLPSHSEGLPMTVLEAWAAGTPVLMTAACNLPEGFAAGAAAEIPLDPAGMADVFTKHLADAGWRAAAGAAGKQLVRRQFSWDGVAESFLALYEHALDRGPRPTVLHD
jgi:poly(glycerol-phosphate) alpha-glucosyltransferase